MHTSYGNIIPLSASPDEIKRAVTSMITDPARIHPTDPGHPEVWTLFTYHQAFNREMIPRIEEACRRGEVGCVQCKRNLVGLLQEKLEPFRRIR
jgi:tryptophanyl-tRNA synthetase